MTVHETKFERDAAERAEDNLQVLYQKHRDYGPKNIANAPGGPLNGLNVRLYDKLARLTHLLETGVDPENESLADTFLDIANYGLIGQMVIEGKWPGTKKYEKTGGKTWPNDYQLPG